jgi:hypothetical protein
MLAKGRLVLPAGSLMLAKGRFVLTAGNLMLAGGRHVLATGSLVLARGRHVLATGSLVLARGSHVLATGSLVRARGSLALAKGSLIFPAGRLILARGRVVEGRVGGAMFLLRCLYNLISRRLCRRAIALVQLVVMVMLAVPVCCYELGPQRRSPRLAFLPRLLTPVMMVAHAAPMILRLLTMIARPAAIARFIPL